MTAATNNWNKWQQQQTNEMKWMTAAMKETNNSSNKQMKGITAMNKQNEWQQQQTNKRNNSNEQMKQMTAATNKQKKTAAMNKQNEQQ